MCYPGFYYLKSRYIDPGLNFLFELFGNLLAAAAEGLLIVVVRERYVVRITSHDVSKC